MIPYQTKKGYFYKESNIGIRKRISKTEYKNFFKKMKDSRNKNIYQKIDKDDLEIFLILTNDNKLISPELFKNCINNNSKHVLICNECYEKSKGYSLSSIKKDLNRNKCKSCHGKGYKNKSHCQKCNKNNICECKNPCKSCHETGKDYKSIKNKLQIY